MLVQKDKQDSHKSRWYGKSESSNNSSRQDQNSPPNKFTFPFFCFTPILFSLTRRRRESVSFIVIFIIIAGGNLSFFSQLLSLLLLVHGEYGP